MMQDEEQAPGSSRSPPCSCMKGAPGGCVLRWHGLGQAALGAVPMLVATFPVSVLPAGASGRMAACSCCSKCWWLAPCRLVVTQNAGSVGTRSVTVVMMERDVSPVSPFLSPHTHFWHVGLLPSPGYQQHHWASSKPTGGANPGPPPPWGGGDPPLLLFLPLESLSSPRRCYNCGGLDHHAKECKLPPQPKKCHFCQSISHMVANCPAKAQQSPSSQGKPAYFREEEDMHSSPLLPETRE